MVKIMNKSVCSRCHFMSDDVIDGVCEDCRREEKKFWPTWAEVKHAVLVEIPIKVGIALVFCAILYFGPLLLKALAQLVRYGYTF